MPLLAFALAGQRVAERVAAFRTHAKLARQIGGGILAVMTLVLATDWTNVLTDIPGYTNALQNHIENGAYAKKQLDAVKGISSTGKLANCTPGTALVRCGPAPAFTGITTWLNTPGDKPITLASLRGKVVLVDFWTYSCINCQRSLPHVEAWYSRYHADGLEVIGVHSPEFAFEHVVSNVVAASHQLGVHYPIAIDNNLATFNAYKNNYWPADYLIDATGQVRNLEDGEGSYGATETDIRQLLVAADPSVHLPPPHRRAQPDTGQPAHPGVVPRLQVPGGQPVRLRGQRLVHPRGHGQLSRSRRPFPSTTWPWPGAGTQDRRTSRPAPGPRSSCPSWPTTSTWSWPERAPSTWP